MIVSIKVECEGGMSDSEDVQNYVSLEHLEKTVNQKYEEIKAARRLLFGRLKQENSKLDSEDKRKLRVLQRKMNKAYKRLQKEDHDSGITERECERILKPWDLYHVQLIYVTGRAFKYTEIEAEDGGDTIHGMEWDNEKGDKSDFERKVETNLTNLLQQLKKSK